MAQSNPDWHRIRVVLVSHPQSHKESAPAQGDHAEAVLTVRRAGAGPAPVWQCLKSWLVPAAPSGTIRAGFFVGLAMVNIAQPCGHADGTLGSLWEPETSVTRFVWNKGQSREGIIMITDGFGPRMVANMEIALERACEFLPPGNEQHEGRRHVASKILECAKTGNGSVHALTAAGRTAAIELHAPAASPRDDGGPLR